ncbi:PH domain-containing protein [Mariniblastus fucicola]|uniref:Bacterial membrane flanked domain protein n=1 Tax=Mariniblastus fucicola TaxID=980251 RepID=A0A5B9PHR9_9BACT|nr:PH domain-containing protein [Mariniblastus fucicola]QEG22431.1 Bacterial membrane flanked domain protein [Mariniblastus fucicola]
MESSDTSEPADWHSPVDSSTSTAPDVSPTDDAPVDPFMAEDGFQSFDPRNISAERVAGAILCVVLGIGGLVGAVIPLFNYGFGWVFVVCVSIAIFLYAVVVYFSIFWPSVQHRHRSWRLTDVGLEIRRGVWWKHLQAIPWARVQHADVSQGPLQRMYGVGTLTVHTAGTSNSSVNFEGLAHEVAIQLRDEVIRQRASGDVV